MKFLKKNNEFYLNLLKDANINEENLYNFYSNFYFEKFFIKNRKVLNNVKLGVIKNIKKTSIKRDKNVEMLKQYINLIQKNGKKLNFLKSFNKSIENLFFVLTFNFDEFKHYKYYNDFVYLHNNNHYFSNINNFFENSLNSLESIFEIKTIKNNKKLKLLNKYTHEIVYIPRKKRPKYVLRALALYKENFKNYNLWERLFWSILLNILNKNNSFLLKRRDYIYNKSIKFFKLKKK